MTQQSWVIATWKGIRNCLMGIRESQAEAEALLEIAVTFGCTDAYVEERPWFDLRSITLPRCP